MRKPEVGGRHLINGWFLDGLEHQVAEGYVRPFTAATQAVAAGNLLIGTIVTSEVHNPVELTTLTPEGLRIITPHDAVRATRAVPTAILTAALGDCNEQGQMYRLAPDGPLVKDIDAAHPNRPRHGWEYDAEERADLLCIPGLWLERLQGMSLDQQLGSIDVIHDDGSFIEFGLESLAQTESSTYFSLYEPGHYYSPFAHKTLASFAVRVGDVLTLSHIQSVPPFSVEELR